MKWLGIYTELLKLIGGFLLLWLAYVFVVPAIPDTWMPDWMLRDVDIGISIEQEEELGGFILETLEIEQAASLDPLVDSAMAVIEHRLLQHIGPTEYEFNVIIVESDQINALTFPGGNIVVFTGLIELSETPEEVAAVLAHEMGHVQMRHVVEKLVTELGLTFVLTIVTGGDATLIHELSRTLLSNVFSRSQEKDADDFALALLERASIEPLAVATFFRKLNNVHPALDEEFEWLMTHPHNNARIKAGMEFKVGEGFAAQDFSLDWEAVKAAL